MEKNKQTRKQKTYKYFHGSSVGEPMESMVIYTGVEGEIQKGLQKGGEP